MEFAQVRMMHTVLPRPSNTGFATDADLALALANARRRQRFAFNAIEVSVPAAARPETS